ncbi:MAG: EH signature domain-containing protein [Cloacibacillus sp.]
MFDNLKELLKVSYQAPGAPCFVPVRSKIKEASVELVDRFEEVKPLSPTNMKEIYSRCLHAWQSGDHSLLPFAQTKYIPGVLFVGENIDSPINNTSFTKFLLDLIISRNKSRRTILSLIKFYLTHYNNRVEGMNLVRVHIANYLKDCEDSSKRIRFWQAMSLIFDVDGARCFAEGLGIAGSARQYLIKLNFDDSIRWGEFMSVVVSNFYLSTSISASRKFEELDGFVAPDYSKNSEYSKAFLSASATVLIPWAANNTQQDPLRQFYLKHLGDPRLLGTKRWDEVTAEAKKIFIQWLAKFDLETFFAIITGSSYDQGWEYRMKFWEAYLPYFENTWVALGTDARRLLHSKLNRNDADSIQYAGLSGVSTDQSIFMFEMRGFLFIEWNTSGALRVWKKAEAPIEIGKRYYTAYFRSWEPYYKQSHYSYSHYSWQQSVKTWIQQNLGISPAKSYRF